MRRSRAATAESRERIVTAAARLLRERGPEGFSVAEVMAAAGMTHGGFYTHFPDKDALLAAATGRAFAERLAALTTAAPTTPHATGRPKAGGAAQPGGPAQAGRPSQAGGAALRGFLDAYLSATHVGAPGSGCPIAGLAAEAGRAGPGLRDVMAAGAAQTLDCLAAQLGGTHTARQQAIRILASALGSVVLARALASPSLAAEVLATMRASAPLAPLLAGPRGREPPTREPTQGPMQGARRVPTRRRPARQGGG